MKVFLERKLQYLHMMSHGSMNISFHFIYYRKTINTRFSNFDIECMATNNVKGI